MSGLLNNVTQSKYKVYQQDMTGQHNWSKYVDQDKLLLTNPEVKPWTDLTYLARIASANGDGTMAAARGSLSKEKTHLMHWLEGSGATQYVDDKWIRWKLFGQGDVKAIMLENIVEQEAPGIQNTEFAIKLDVDWYGRGDILAPERNKRYQVIVVDGPIPDGGGFKYKVRLLNHNGDPAAYFPVEYLNPGDYWCKVMSATSEAGKDSGTLQVGNNFSYVEFQVKMSRGKWGVKVTDEAHRTNLVVAPCDKTGAPIPEQTKIISTIEAQGMQQIEMEKEYWTLFGTQAEGIIDKSSLKEYDLGPGILSFLEDGNVFPYSIENGSINQIVNYLNTVWFDRVSPGNRNVMFLGGQGFIELFDKWIREEFAETATVQHTDFVLKSGAKSFNPDMKGYGFPAYQFTEYLIRPFGKITIGHLPLFDSTYITSVREPKTGYPITSFEAIAFDIGLGNGKSSNVKMLKRRNSEYYDYICGMWTPAGPSNGQSKFRPAHSGQYYEMIYGIDFGAVVFDISLTMWLKPKYVY